MDADFDRFYNGRDLGKTIWVDRWSASKILSRISALPEDSAFARSVNQGHTSLHELLAQTRDAVVTAAHGYRLEGAPKPYPRPEREEPTENPDAVSLSDPKDAEAIKRFFGAARH